MPRVFAFGASLGCEKIADRELSFAPGVTLACIVSSLSRLLLEGLILQICFRIYETQPHDNEGLKERLANVREHTQTRDFLAIRAATAAMKHAARDLIIKRL